MLKKQGIVPKTIARFIVNGTTLDFGVHAAKTVVADGKGDLEPYTRKQLTGDCNATDVQLKLELATLTVVHEIANGHLIQSGANALRHAMEEIKIEHESCNNLLRMEEWIALERQHNSGIVTCRDAPSIVFGVIGANGTCVLRLVEEECKDGRAAF